MFQWKSYSFNKCIFAVITVSESTSMDVLSGGESDAGDTLNRTNNNNR